MKTCLSKLLKKSNRAGGSNPPLAQRKEVTVMQTDFMNGITFEENPFEDETPDEVVIYDTDGNEVLS